MMEAVMSSDYRCGRGFTFEAGDIDETVARKGLLALEMDVSRDLDTLHPEALTAEEIQEVFRQARALGARNIALAGGEPMTNPRLQETISWIRDMEMDVALLTDGTRVSEDTARFLFENGVEVVIRMASRQQGLRNQLCGEPGVRTVASPATMVG